MWITNTGTALERRHLASPGGSARLLVSGIATWPRGMLSVMEAWETFTVIIGSAAAALIGLLFVAVSIKVDAIAASAELRNRAAQTLGLFVTVLSIGVLLAIPGQPYRVLGAELIALAVLSGGVLYALDRRASVDTSSQPVGRLLEVVTPNTITSLLLLASGLVLVNDVHAGLYVLVAPILVALIGGVTSAWLLLIRTTQ
jgi:hypothetical protein